MRRVLLFLTAVCCSLIVNAQSSNIKGVYVADIPNWIGDTAQENSLLRYTRDNNLNYITLYNLQTFNWGSSTKKSQLAKFIKKAKTEYGIIQFGAAGETYNFFINYIIPYNNIRTDTSERFTVFNFEFEFWLQSRITSTYANAYLIPNGLTADTAGAFAYAYKQFQKIDSLCTVKNIISEVYFGWPNKGQMQKMAMLADRILLHCYRPNDVSIYSYGKTRLEDIASIGRATVVMPIFSAEPEYMHTWLQSHSLSDPYTTYSNSYVAETGTYKQNINLQGYQWYVYDFLKTVPSQATITANGPTTFCAGGNVQLTASSGSSFLWSTGDTTQSITVSAAGTYTVTVKSSAGINSTSQPTVVSVITSTSPQITASGPTNFCTGGSVTLSTATANSYLWSNGATTQSITVNTTGNYSVTITKSGCNGSSQPVAVNVTAVPSTPTITASGSLNICPGSVITLTCSSANSYLWSNGATTRSIAVTGAGSYFVKAFAGANCSATSATKTTTLLTAPSKPTISVIGSTTLTTSQPSVTLTSSSASAYKWNSGSTSRSISVNAAGSYRVTAIASNGCRTTSNAVAVSQGSCTPPAVPVITLSGSNILNPGQTVTLTSTSASGYRWSTGATTRSITVNSAGTYYVTVYSGSNCFATSLNTNIVMLSARQASIIANDNTVFQYYPNPAKEKLNIKLNVSNDTLIHLQLFSLLGKVEREYELSAESGENNFEIDIPALSSGLYFLRYNDSTYKLMIE